MTKKTKATGNGQVIAVANEEKRNHYLTLLNRFVGIDAPTQRARLLAALRYAPVTTYEARKYLDVYDVPARIIELRAQGFHIITLRVAQETDAGIIHRRIGLYVLQSEGVNHG
jgi:Helix-turn-helix domain